ncbi:MAG: cohesin domain-containing protein [Ignavibacteriales bacterium]|nr:cohesin domain-containing protein [Ignavibacteriales bacterium]
MQKFDSAGHLLKLWGRQGSSSGQFQRNSAIAVDKDNNVYVTDGTNRVQKFSSDGMFLMQWGSTGNGDGQFVVPRGITIDNQGFVYVVDHGTYNERSRVQKFTSSGVYVAKWDLGVNQWDGTPRLAGMSIDRSGNLFLVDDGEKKIYRFTPGGSLLARWDCADPSGLGVDGSGSIYVVSGQDGGSIVTKYALYGQDYTIPTLTALAPSTVLKGSDFGVEVRISDSIRTANVFGVGFDLNFTNTSYVDFVSADTSGCFLGSSLLYILTPDDANGKVSVGLSRKAPTSGVSGGGTVVKLKFRVSTNAPDNGKVIFRLSNISANDANGTAIVLTPVADTTTITPNLNIWPGDMDNSGVVNQNDILPLGVYWGKTGLARSSPSTQWLAQSAIPWSPSGATFADANGDGVVNQADVLPIGLNWGKTRPAITTAISVKRSEKDNVTGIQGTPVLRAIGPISVRGKSTFDVNVMLGDTISPASSLFGISFVLDFAGSKGTIQATEATSGSLLGNDVIFYPQIDNASGNVAIGVTRKSGGGEVTGFGQLAKIKFQVVNNTTSSSFAFTTRDIAANDGSGNALVVQASSNTVLVSINDAAQVPRAYRLDQNFPNPFNPSTRIAFSIPQTSRVRLSILDVLGREVVLLVEDERLPGMYNVLWDAGSMPSGTYFYRLHAGEFVATKKMLLLR